MTFQEEKEDQTQHVYHINISETNTNAWLKLFFFSQFPHVEFNELSQISVIICCNFYSLSRLYKIFTKRKNSVSFNSYRAFFFTSNYDMNSKVITPSFES